MIATVAPTTASTTGLEWVVVKDDENDPDYAQVINNMLKINKDTPYGTKIKVMAKSGSVESNVLEITYGIAVESVEIESAGSYPNILQGTSVDLNVAITPNNATAKDDFVFEIIEGAEYGKITANTLFVYADAETGALIKVKATVDGKESNILEFIVGYPLEKIELNSEDILNIENGNSKVFNLTYTPANATNIDLKWTFEKGGEYCTITGTTITIDDDAPIGAEIVLYAKSGEIETKTIKIIVGFPANSIVASVNSLILLNKEFDLNNINVAVEPANASVSKLVWSIVKENENDNFAQIINNKLLINEETPIETKIKLVASIGNTNSNELEFTYGIAVESVEIQEASASTEIVKGTSVVLNAIVTPNNATAKDNIVWEITEGSEYGKMTGNTLSVYADAPTGSIIRVRATCDGVESNVLEFEILPTQNEINASKFIIGLSDSKLTLDRNGTSLPKLVVNIYNLNFDAVTDCDITYTVVEGQDCLQVIDNGYNCSFNILAHGKAVVEVSTEGAVKNERVEVNVIVPPDAVSLPEVFAERAGYVYNFSKIDLQTKNVETLPFVASVKGTGVCQDLKYTFMHEDGTTGDEVAVWSDGKITFNKTGKVTVIVSSVSGSAVETTTSYSFNINEGYNVYTFGQLQRLASSSYYKGEQINIVVLEKPQSIYNYGYDLVSEAGKKAAEDQTLQDVLYGENNSRGNGQIVYFVNKSAHINGNKHKIDLSHVRHVTQEEIDSIVAKDSAFNWYYFRAIISILPWNSDPDKILSGAYEAKVYDLELVGNCPIDYDGALYRKGALGGIHAGLNVGDRYHDTRYYVDIKNVTASSCRNGLQIEQVAGNGLIENVYTYNCYSNGIEITSSVVRLKDIKFGLNGAAGIELAPSESSTAGEDFNQKQTITFEGEITLIDAFSNGNSKYFENYLVFGNSIPTVINGVLAQFDTTQASHMRNANGEFGFVCFTLIDFSTQEANHSQFNYPAYQQGGIINAKDLPGDGESVNTTHQYIELDVDLSFLVSGLNAGKILLYNQNYIPA